MRLEISSLDYIFVTQASTIITTQGDDIRAIAAKYFSTVHCWLPIVNKKAFYRRIITLQTAPSAELAMLLLCIYLAIQLPDPKNSQISTHGGLYNMVKYFYSFLQADRSPSLVLIQCGILISIYEHGQDMSQAAYLSIGTCATMGHALQLHKIREPESPKEVDIAASQEEATRVWWGVIVLDRYIFPCL
jgi:hypothetical protein